MSVKVTYLRLDGDAAVTGRHDSGRVDAYVHRGGEWRPIHPADAALEAREVTAEDFTKEFGQLALPPNMTPQDG